MYSSLSDFLQATLEANIGCMQNPAKGGTTTAIVKDSTGSNTNV